MNSSQQTAYGFGVAIQTKSGQTLDCSFHTLGLGSAPANNPANEFKSQLGEDQTRNLNKIAVEISIDLAEKPKDATDVFLRLHLLSHRLVKPHGLNLEGIFALLSNVVWTSAGACEVEGFDNVRRGLQNKYGNLTVYSVDKFPRMIDYVIPEGVRIADDPSNLRRLTIKRNTVAVVTDGSAVLGLGNLGAAAAGPDLDGQEMRPGRRRRHRQVSPARRLRCLRGPGPPGPGLRPAISPGRRAGELRQHRRR